MSDCLVAGKPSITNHPGQLSIASLGVAKSSTSFGWGTGRNVISAGWQVTLCDSIWHASSRNGEACALQTAIPTLLFYVTLQIPCGQHWLAVVLPFLIAWQYCSTLNSLSVFTYSHPICPLHFRDRIASLFYRDLWLNIFADFQLLQWTRVVFQS